MVVRERVPRWESELWSYLNSSDGMHCPFYEHCHVRLIGKWCLDDERERLDQILDSERYRLNDLRFIGCGTCGRIFKMVEMLAWRYLKKGGVRSPPVPTEIVSLMDQERPIQLRPVRLVAHHGAVWRLKDEWVIHLNKDETSNIQRFTIFHEAFHILARRKTTPAFRKKRGPRETPFKELLANYFAACILMPDEWVKETWAEVKDINQMAEFFAVPETAMGIRLKHLGLF